jgi:hypothetical protein
MTSKLYEMPVISVDWSQAAKLLSTDNLHLAVEAYMSAIVTEFKDQIVAMGYDTLFDRMYITFTHRKVALELLKECDGAVARVTAFFAVPTEGTATVDEQVHAWLGDELSVDEQQRLAAMRNQAGDAPGSESKDQPSLPGLEHEKYSPEQ